MDKENNQNPGEITLMIHAIQEGKKEKINDLIPRTIKEIRRIAKQKLYKSNLNNEMSVTTVVHELYIKLEKHINNHDSFLEKKEFNAQSSDFYALCAKTIQHLIIDYCRRSKNRSEATDSIDDITKDFTWLSSKEKPIDVVLIVDEALTNLRETGFERAEKVIRFKYFGGFSDAEISEILGIAIPTIQRDLRTAESRLYFFLNPQVKEIYEKAVKISDKEKREGFIGESCGDDEKLLKVIKSLIK